MDRTIGRNLITRVNVADMLVRSAARSPDALALVDGARQMTYRQFNASVNRTAAAFAGLGYARGDVLALMSTNNIAFLAVYYACAKLGVVCVPINLFWRHRELSYVLAHARAKGAVVERELIDQLRTGLDDAPGVEDVIVIGGSSADEISGRHAIDFETIVEAGSPDEPAALVEDRDPISYLYTSGTTSTPKGVVSSHLAVYLESLGVAIDTRMTANDRITALMPLFHTAQLNAFVTPAIAVGATLFIQKGFDANRLLDLIESERITFVFALPMMYRAMLEQLEACARDVAANPGDWQERIDGFANPTNPENADETGPT